jgi:hypothetical protein
MVQNNFLYADPNSILNLYNSSTNILKVEEVTLFCTMLFRGQLVLWIRGT